MTPKKLLRGCPCGFLRQLCVNVNLNVLANHHRGSLCAYSKVFAINTGGSRESTTFASTALNWRRWTIDIERYFLGHAVNGEIANDFKFIVAVLAQAL